MSGGRQWFPALPLALAALAARGAGTADLELWQARANVGDPEAMTELGDAYAAGEIVAPDLSASLRYYQAAAAKNYAPAEFNLAAMYELGRGVRTNLPEAFRDYLAAARLGYAPAQFNVGNMYAAGSGVPADPAEAAVWFRQAAEHGIAAAQYNLALAYERGRGVVRDDAAAQRWYRAAAQQGYARARYNLGLMLEEGRGAPADLAAAAELYRLAALQGLGLAQNNYGILLAEGKGGLRADPVAAYAWVALAAENGAKPEARDRLAQVLTPAQLAEGGRQLATLRIRARGDRQADAQARILQLQASIQEMEEESRNSIIDSSGLKRRLQGARDELKQLQAGVSSGLPAPDRAK